MFRRVARGYEEDLVLVRGWGFDTRIFDGLDLPFNYLLYEGACVPGLTRDLETGWPGRAARPLHLLGWSLGAYAVAEFARTHPERVAGLWLVGAREAYRPEDVAVVRHALRRNRRGFLRKFYKDCYRGHAADLYRAFKTDLQPGYLERWQVGDLEADLDWICDRRLDITALDTTVPLIVVHGRADHIVPEAEAAALAAGLRRGRFLAVPEAGHLPFLHPDFARLVHGRG